MAENKCSWDEKWKPNSQRITEIEQSDDFGSKHLKQFKIDLVHFSNNLTQDQKDTLNINYYSDSL